MNALPRITTVLFAMLIAAHAEKPSLAPDLIILNAAVRNAVVAWKFTPIRDNTGARCVETEIPFLIKLSQ